MESVTNSKITRNTKINDIDSMRYPSVGDYYLTMNGGNVVFEIADTGDEGMNLLILFHEMLEEYLTRKKGIAEPDIMAFDVMYEEERAKGLHKETDEPGMDKRCIYREEHKKATKLERYAAKLMKVNWKKYGEIVNNL